MRIRVICALTLVFVLLSSSLCMASFPQENWHYYKELQVDSAGFAAIELDSEVMKNSQECFADLRVTDLRGKEIPSQIIQPETEEVVNETKLINAIDYPDYSSVMLDLGPNPQPHNRLTLYIETYEDYLCEVDIETSTDTRNWGKLGKGKIFSYEGEQSNEISYPTSNLRYLRVNIQNSAGEKPIKLKVSSAQVKFLPANLYEGTLIVTKMTSMRSDKTKTNIVMDLGIPNYLVTGLEIKTADRNFNRRVSCTTDEEASSINDEGKWIKSERILSYKWGNYLSVKDSIEINQYCKQYLLLTIFNGNSPPLEITEINVYGSNPILIADLDSSSRLWYGNASAETPTYDLYDFANLIEKNAIKMVKPGSQQLNPDYKAPVIPWTERHKWLLDVVIILVAGGFILFILKNFKQIKEKEEQN